MSVATQPSSGVDLSTRVRYGFADGMVVMRRNLLQILRIPTALVFELAQPIMFVLLFTIVFAGNIANLPPGFTYVMFLMPGIFVQNAIFGSTTTAIGLAEDMKKGLVDRFRSLPMARSAVLSGRTFADILYNTGILIVLMLSGLVVGWRVNNGLGDFVDRRCPDICIPDFGHGNLAEGHVFGKPARRKILFGAREQGEQRAAGGIGPASAAMEPSGNAGAVERVL